MRAVLRGGDVIEKAHSQAEQVQQIPIDALHPFTNHPFKVLDDEAMTRTVEAYNTARSESMSSFGDDTVYLEKFVEEPPPTDYASDDD